MFFYIPELNEEWCFRDGESEFHCKREEKVGIMGSSSAVMSRGMTPEQQIKSRESFGVCGNSGMLLTSKTLKSLVKGRLVLSMCILKSPSGIMFGERADR